MKEKINTMLLVLWRHVVKGLKDGLWTSVICLLILIIQLVSFFDSWTNLSIVSQMYIKSHLSQCEMHIVHY